MLVKPRLLFVSPRFLFPMDQGGKIRTGNILRGLKGGVFDVTLVSPAPINYDRYATDVNTICDRFLTWDERPYSWLRRRLALASRLPVAAAIDRSSVGAMVVSHALAERPDVIVVDFPHADVLIPQQIDVASVMFTHNVEAEIFERHAARAVGLWRMIWADQGRKMAHLEQRSLNRYDSVVAVSTRDRNALVKRYQLPVVEVIDTGVDLDFFSMNLTNLIPDSDGGTIVFTATMNWAANVDGIHFLLDEVFPRISRVRPRIRAIIIGRDPPKALSEKIAERGLNVTLTGLVDDIRPYVAQANVYVIPLFVGSGTRIKAFEAMAMGRPIVSTAVGMEGLDVTHGENVLCANDADTFASSILALMGDASMRTRIALAARRLVENRFSWSLVARQFEMICLQTLRRKA
jgi:glycosyltransferase involved in cell wall biosynthesis